MTVDQFNSYFRKSWKRIDPNGLIPVQTILSIYKGALKPNIATQVFLRDPNTLANAENYARNAELALGMTANVKSAEIAAIEALTTQIQTLQLQNQQQQQPQRNNNQRNNNNNNNRWNNNRNNNYNNNRRG